MIFNTHSRQKMPMKYGSVISWRGWVIKDTSLEMSQRPNDLIFREMSKNIRPRLICEMEYNWNFHFLFNCGLIYYANDSQVSHKEEWIVHNFCHRKNSVLLGEPNYGSFFDKSFRDFNWPMPLRVVSYRSWADVVRERGPHNCQW